MNDPIFLIIDLFCGFGGTTTGFDQAEYDGGKIAKVIACVNHDPKAIKSHWLNHPEVIHFEEDIRTLDLTGLVAIKNHWQAKYPNAFVVLWASLECTNFSKAKGGQPRNADSRTLAEHLFRYQEALNPDYIKIENVVEFMSWGPLDENGKPLSRKNGQGFMKWRNEMCSYGYRDDWKELNSADFGAYTSRNRLFGCFAKHGLPIVWPDPTHSKKASAIGMFHGLKKWMPVKEVLNFEDEGESIFNRKKSLSDKTLERIYAGLIKYVAKDDKTQFLLKYNSTNGETGKHIPPSINEPCPVVSCQSRLGLVQTEFLASYYGNGDNISSVNSPAPTLPTKDRCPLIQPMHSDNHAVPFLMDTQFNNGPQSVENPAGVITANRKHHYIVNPSHGGHSTSTENPCPVIVARQDKAPLYVVQCEEGKVAIPVYDTDTEICIKIKQFMVAFSLVDIKMRMLRVQELLRIQGFPDQYQMVGNQSDHKKFIGNSVHPKVPKAWAEAFALKLMDAVKHIAA